MTEEKNLKSNVDNKSEIIVSNQSAIVVANQSFSETLKQSFQEALKQWFQEDIINKFFKPFVEYFSDTFSLQNFQLFPNEDTAKLSWKAILKIFLVVACLLTIIYVFISFNKTTQGHILSSIATGIAKLITWLSPIWTRMGKFFIGLMVDSMIGLWIPISIYVVSNILTKNSLIRLLLFITIILVMALLLTNINLISIKWDVRVWKIVKFDLGALVFMFNCYFLFLLMTPTALWKIFSFVFLFIVGLVLTAIPNIPIVGGALDLSIFSGVAAFLFFFLHTAASITKFFTKNLSSKLKLLDEKLA